MTQSLNKCFTEQSTKDKNHDDFQIMQKTCFQLLTNELTFFWVFEKFTKIRNYFYEDQIFYFIMIWKNLQYSSMLNNYP